MTTPPPHVFIDTVVLSAERLSSSSSHFGRGHSAHVSSSASQHTPKHLLSLPSTPNEAHLVAQSYPPRRYGSSPLQADGLGEALLSDTLRSPSFSPSVDGASELSLSSCDSFQSAAARPSAASKSSPALPTSSSSPSSCSSSPSSSSARASHPPLVTSVELSTLLTIAYPIALSILCRTAQSLTDLSFLGHLSTDALAGSSAALLWMNLTSAVLYRAFGTAVNTLCAQAYGAGNMPLVGLWLQLSIVLNTAATIPLAVSWWFTGDMLRLIGVSLDMADYAATFARWSITSTWPILIYECLSRYFQAQGVVIPALTINFALVFGNIGLNYWFVLGVGGYGGWGFVGSPLATATCRWILLLVFWAYMFLVRDSRQCWHGWSRRCLERERVRVMLVDQFLPLTLGFALEEFQLELISVFAVRLGEVQLAVENSVMTVYLVLSSLMLGLSAATTVRVAHWLGAGRPKAARKTAVISFWCSLLVGLLTGLAFVLLRSYIGRVFSDDAEVHALTSQICLLLGPCYFLLSALYTAFAVLDAQARPMMVALAFVVGGWGVSVPLAYVFAFTLGDGLIGLWYGMTLGYIVISVIAGWAAVTSDWRRCSVEAMVRSRDKKEHGEAVAGAGDTDGKEDSPQETNDREESVEEEKEHSREEKEAHEEEEEEGENEAEEEEDGEDEEEEEDGDDDEAAEDDKEDKFVTVSMRNDHRDPTMVRDRRTWNAR